MQDRYDPSTFEASWRQRWQEADLFATRTDPGRPKFYGLDFFPYPSGAGLSVGHCRNYVPTDILCRMKYMQGYNVLHPMGFDAFGLPAENEAIKNKVHPGTMIDRYAATYRRQMELVGIGFDWSRSFKSCDPSYYKWTQWIFKKLYEKGLAYRKNAEVNWCPNDKTALANEEVVGGLCERCGTPVERRQIPQWFFKITEYAQRLLDDLDTIDWPEGIKDMQRNWIGRSEGVEFSMKLALPDADTGSEPDFEIVTGKKHPFLRVFTTRIDTIFGMTFCVVAPEHPLVPLMLARASDSVREEAAAYIEAAKNLSDVDRQATTREKTGVYSGIDAINPSNGKRVPIWIADYVLINYGTGAIMAVPGHDERDFEFATKFGLDVIQVIAPADGREVTLPYSANDGVLLNSGEYSGQTVSESQAKLAEWIEGLGLGERKVNYKLRDWLISRQRYWGCPIPVVYSADDEIQLVPDEDLPVYLPSVEHYEPSDDGASPLSRIEDFVRVTDRNGRLGRRETDTMGGFACSSWYFLRFADPHNDDEGWNQEAIKYWLPVDCYVGGAEHAVMHLLYARFWTKVLFDLGLVGFEEPFKKLHNQGQVLGQTPYRQPKPGETLKVGEDAIQISYVEAAAMPEGDVQWRWSRMSKSRGNVVTPDEAVENYGADALRIYEAFVAPFEQDVQWNNDGLSAAARYLSRVFKMASEIEPVFDPDWAKKIASFDAGPAAKKIRQVTHRSIQKVSSDIDGFAFNTYISQMMIFLNTINDELKSALATEDGKLALSEALETYVLLLSPVAPHSSDELHQNLKFEGFVYHRDWPTALEELCKADQNTIAVQVNGKLRDTFVISAQATNEEIEAAALSRQKVVDQIKDSTVRKVIVIPNKLVNIVAN